MRQRSLRMPTMIAALLQMIFKTSHSRHIYVHSATCAREDDCVRLHKPSALSTWSSITQRSLSPPQSHDNDNTQPTSFLNTESIHHGTTLRLRRMWHSTRLSSLWMLARECSRISRMESTAVRRSTSASHDEVASGTVTNNAVL